MIKIFTYSFMFFCSLIVSGQATVKKALTPEDYGLWHTLYFKKLSPEGNWVSFQLNYQDDNDTLFVKNTRTDQKYGFPKGNKGVFTPHGKFFLCELPKRQLVLLNLANGQKKQYENVMAHNISNSGKHIGIIQNKDGTSRLRLINLSSGKEIYLNNVLEFSFRPQSDLIAYVERKGESWNLRMMALDKKGTDKIIASGHGKSFKFLQWNGTGKALVFFKGNPDEKFVAESFHYYSKGQLRTLDMSVTGFKGEPVLPSNPRTRVFFSKDASKVFFGTRDPKENAEKPSDNDQVQIWHYRDELVYPKKDRVGDWGKLPLLSMWEPLKGKFRRIGSREHPNAVITQDSKHALLFHPMGSGVQHEQFPDVDYYLMDLNTGRQRKILEKQRKIPGLTQLSPSGRYISYWREKHWWVYDIKKDTHTNVTKGIGVDFFDRSSDTQAGTFASPGWAQDDSGLLVYDAYDIWLIKPDGTSAVKITDGRAEKKSYRLYDKYITDYPMKLFVGYQATVYDLNSELLLSVKEESAQSGFARWEKRFGVRDLVYGPERITNLRRAKNKETYVYVSERFDAPPKLVSLKEGITPKTIFRSNPQHTAYSWGKAKLIEYVTHKGDTLQGALYYPADYKKGEKYAMVVNIYEKLSQQLHKYKNPGYNNLSGYNKTYYTLNGYFVLEPDIYYELSNPGMSAVDAVEASVLKVFSLGDVDTEKVGLIGHSYGGYEAAFIASQSNLFATAVAGNGIHNLISWYLTLNKDTFRPEIWRFETQQMRMGTPYYENMYAYLQNSTIHQVKGINTPLLLWAGKKDGNIDWRQSLELYLALRRRGKTSALLVYPNEEHSILNPLNKKDLTIRIEQWMDYYLKGNPPADWILKGEPKFQ